MKDFYRMSEDTYSHNKELKPLGNGDYFLRYEITSGNYPEEYTTELCYLHIIPEKNKMRLETCFIVRWFRRYNETTGSESRSGERIDIQKNGVFERTEYSPQWEFVGYSTDKNNLYAEIYKFYKTYE